MQGNGETTAWEEKHREEYNSTGDKIFVAHSVCRFFHKNHADCKLSDHPETVYGKLTNLKVPKGFYKQMMDTVARLADVSL